jgi:purine-binding chemotaxis protein CheW
MAATQQFCSFFVDGLCFGIEVARVQEIRNTTAMTRVPLAARVVGGLLNLRGHIVTAVDLRRCLDLSDRPADQQPVNVILRTADGGVSLLVDRMGDVLDVAEGDFELPPRTLNARSRELIRGAYRLDGGLLLVLNIEPIVNGIADDPSDQPGAARPHLEGNRPAVVNSGGA